MRSVLALVALVAACRTPPWDEMASRAPRCGRSCGVVAIARGQRSPRSVAVDETAAYWVNSGDDQAATGEVMRLDLDGGSDAKPVRLSAGEARPWAGIALDGAWVYYTDGGLYPDGRGSVRRVPKEGGPVDVVAPDEVDPLGLAADEARLYFTEGRGGTVRSVGKSGGPVVQLAAGLDYPIGIAVDGGVVYFCERDAGRVRRVSRSGGPVADLAVAVDPERLVVAGGVVYFSDRGQHRIARVGTDGSGGATLVLDAGLPYALAAASGRLYWNSDSGGTVESAALPSGGDRTRLATTPGELYGLAVDADAVYFTDTSGGNVYRVAR